MTTEKNTINQGIQVISRAATILRTLSVEPDGLSLGQISRKVDLPRSTVQRIVAALVSEGFVSSDGSYGGIRLGPEILNLARASAADVRERFRPAMRQIAEKTGETVDLAILDRGRMLFVDQVVGNHRLRTVSSIGETFPLTTTANGKAALSCMRPSDAARLVIAELDGETDNERSLAGVLSELEAIRDHGLAVDANEHTDGISALGIAVEIENGKIYSLSTPVPSSRFPFIREKLSRELLECRANLQSELF